MLLRSVLLDLNLVLLLHSSLLVSVTSLLDLLESVFGEMVEASPGVKVGPELVERVDVIHVAVIVSNDGALVGLVDGI